MYSVNCELYTSGVISKQEKGSYRSRLFSRKIARIERIPVRVAILVLYVPKERSGRRRFIARAAAMLISTGENYVV